MVKWDQTQCRMSPGKRIKAIVINIFGRRRPLYRIDEFYEHMDIENLFGRGVSLEELTDYNLARTLDKLAERGPHEVFSTLCLRAIGHEQIALNYLYSDTTSISVHGDYEYEQATDSDFFITYGHSKDKRPDLKQFLYGLSVTEDKVPVAAEVNSGNLSDKTWNFEYIEKLAATLTPEMLSKVVYVADSALVTEANLEKLKQYNLKFISRLPGNFSLEEELKDRAWEEDSFLELGTFSSRKDAASYRCRELPGSIGDDDYRFLVVHSSKLDGRKARSLEKKLAKRNSALDKEIKNKMKETYACCPDAEAACAQFIKEHRDEHFAITGKIIAEEKRKPGRPGKNSATATVYRLQIEASLDREAVQRAKERLSCFVLITNLDQEYSPHEVLKQYKAQSKVETSFKFLKDPLFVGPVFLKKPGRVQALAYVLLMALLMFGLLERRVREAIKYETEPLVIPGKVKTFRPTGKKILKSLESVMVMTTEDPNRRAFGSRFKVPRVLILAGFSPDIYPVVKERSEYLS
ncbi:MAG: IS1634 family transposase [Bacillota bacterium]